MNNAKSASESSALPLSARYGNDMNGEFSAPTNDMDFVNTSPIDALVIGEQTLSAHRPD